MCPRAALPTAQAPFAVGVRQTVVVSSEDPTRQLPTTVWYPAVPPGQPRPAPAPHPLGLPHDASPGLQPIGTPCPVVAFSHGNSGFALQSTFLTTHLARLGAIVIAPDHVGNTFAEMAALGDDDAARREVHRAARTRRPGDLVDALRSLVDRPGAIALDPRQLPPVDPERLGLLGHSFGGWTAIKGAARERRVRAVCALAPVAEPFVGRRAFDPGELPLPPGVHALLLAAADDVLVDLETSILPLVDRLGPAARLEIIDRADHFHFCDGLALLHRMHENNPRASQLRPTRPFAELRGEAEMHALLRDRVGGFFAEAFGLMTDGDGARAEAVQA
ncbi:MAG: hypothetical protein H6748_06485 [Spirochaetaceae bacterium]|nr:hypothetical protein [Myxococcales bacterium]MCB9723676.1 hypothetical protein [Spirochaetaceae bacterium]HPG26274.1 hypothetical protein [Myxococcota bacterium]